MKKQHARLLFALCFLIVLTGGLLIACAPTPAAPTQPPAPAAPTQPAAPAATKPPATAAAPQPTAPPATKPAAAPTTLNIGADWEQNSLQPETDGIYMMRFGFLETLVGVSYDDKLVPALATKWDRVDDLTWKFTLRSGVKFHNGQPFNAAAAVFALKRAFAAKGADSSLQGATIEAQGADAIVIRTAKASNIIPAVMSDWATGILAKESFDAQDKVTTPIGTGAFKYVDWTRGQRLTVTKFDDYWGTKAKVDRAVFHFVPDGRTRATMLRTGEVHIARAIPVEDATALKNDAKVTIVNSPLRRFRAMFFNNSKPPFNNVKVRQAINYAINKQAILTGVHNGYGAVAEGPFVPGLPWSPTLTGYKYDVEKAKALLKEAGASDLAFTIVTYTGRPELPVIAEVVQQQLKQIGVKVDIQIVEYTPLEQQLLAGNYQATLLARNPAFRVYDPQSFLDSDYKTKGTFNISQYSNSAVDDLVGKATAEKEAEARYKLQQQIQKTVVDTDAISVFLSYYVQIDGYTKSVSGYRTHPTEFLLISPDISLTLP